jgi:hypothetical protein
MRTITIKKEILFDPNDVNKYIVNQLIKQLTKFDIFISDDISNKLINHKYYTYIDFDITKANGKFYIQLPSGNNASIIKVYLYSSEIIDVIFAFIRKLNRILKEYYANNKN